MNAEHSKTMQELDESLLEANRIKHAREKQLHTIKLEVMRMKLLHKINNDYAIERD